MKEILVLVHDYWHSLDSIKPMVDTLACEAYHFTLTTDPADLLRTTPDLLITLKDPIENDQIPTPVWCDEAWTKDCLSKVESGMGMLAMHAAVTDLDVEHEMVQKVIKGIFLMHPAPCPVRFEPIKSHPILEDIEAFLFPEPDEQYHMQLCDNLETDVIASTVSTHGTQPALWVHTLGQGRICCLTPSHTTANLTCEPIFKLVQNAIRWCLK